MAGCAAHQGPSLTETARQYSPVRIASAVPAKPGSLAWSPDGSRLAFIGPALAVYDTRSGGRKSFPVDNPSYVAWAADGTLYVLAHDKTGRTVLYALAPEGSPIKVLDPDHDIDALFPASNGKTLIMVSTALKRLSFGTTISNQVILQDTMGGRTTSLYRFSKTYVMKNPDGNSLTAWTHAGPSPLDDAILVMEHVVPPAVPSYTRVNIVDLASGEPSEISNPDARKLYLSASWSPDGKRVAVTDANGWLEIRDRFGKGVVPSPPVAGLYPSWSRGGSRIYVGGHLIDADGKNRETLLTGAERSIAQWSPDGKTLAVATGDAVLLFQNMHAAYTAPDGPLDVSLAEKIALLKSLLSTGVLSPQEYRERRDSLIRKPEEAK